MERRVGEEECAARHQEEGRGRVVSDIRREAVGGAPMACSSDNIFSSMAW